MSEKQQFQAIMSDSHLHAGNRAVQLALCELIEIFYIDGVISREEYLEAMEWIK